MHKKSGKIHIGMLECLLPIRRINGDFFPPYVYYLAILQRTFNIWVIEIK